MSHGEEQKGVTYQLSLCEVFLPPEIPVHGREHGKAVVGVHEDVDETVQGGSEEACNSPVYSGKVTVHFHRTRLVLPVCHQGR